MVISTQTSYLGKVFGDEKALRVFSEAGFKTLDYSFFMMHDDDNVFNTDGYFDVAKKIRKAADALGIEFNQTHAPFRFDWSDEERGMNDAKFRVIRSLEISSILGAKIAVVHPIHHMLYKGSEKEIMQLNREYYGSLIPYSKKYNVKIAIENMWQKDPLREYCVDDVCSKADEFAAFVDEMNQVDNCFVACLDLGHCGLIGEKAEDAIRVLGKDRLKSLHVHDNNYHKDDHTIPGLGKMNFPAISAALSEIGYDGEFTLEADKFLFGFDKEFLPTAVKFMHDVAKFWADKV